MTTIPWLLWESHYHLAGHYRSLLSGPLSRRRGCVQVDNIHNVDLLRRSSVSFITKALFPMRFLRSILLQKTSIWGNFFAGLIWRSAFNRNLLLRILSLIYHFLGGSFATSWKTCIVLQSIDINEWETIIIFCIFVIINSVNVGNISISFSGGEGSSVKLIKDGPRVFMKIICAQRHTLFVILDERISSLKPEEKVFLRRNL